MEDKVQSLIKLLEEKKENTNNAKSIMQKHKEYYIKKVEDLFSEIKDMLKPLEEQNLVTIIEKSISLNEEGIGGYNVNELHITIDTKSIVLIPQGTMFLGVYGNILLRFGMNELELVLRNTDPHKDMGQWSSWKETPWSILIRKNGVSFKEFNMDIFLDIIMDLTQK